jgi:hypothetical protein
MHTLHFSGHVDSGEIRRRRDIKCALRRLVRAHAVLKNESIVHLNATSRRDLVVDQVTFLLLLFNDDEETKKNVERLYRRAGPNL